jgi:hypothetical protein
VTPRGRHAGRRRDREKALPDAWWRAGIWRPQGSRNGNYRHGRYIAEAIASRRWSTPIRMADLFGLLKDLGVHEELCEGTTPDEEL